MLKNATLEEAKLAMQCGLTWDAFRRVQSIELLLKGYEVNRRDLPRI